MSSLLHCGSFRRPHSEHAHTCNHAHTPPQASAILRKSFSDLRFAAGNRVFLPFRKIASEWCDPFTITTHTDRMNLIDLDGHSQLDISGSYGVNVVGYERYKEFITKVRGSTVDSEDHAVLS